MVRVGGGIIFHMSDFFGQAELPLSVADSHAYEVIAKIWGKFHVLTHYYRLILQHVS